MVFVPEWGWVGSLIWKRSDESHINFRPRVGLDWFFSAAFYFLLFRRFSSPSGDGLVLHIKNKCAKLGVFSSPLGVGLVHLKMD